MKAKSKFLSKKEKAKFLADLQHAYNRKNKTWTLTYADGEPVRFMYDTEIDEVIIHCRGRRMAHLEKNEPKMADRPSPILIFVYTEAEHREWRRYRREWQKGYETWFAKEQEWQKAIISKYKIHRSALSRKGASE